MKGLYIHIPFCKRKCEYCDFVSFAGMESYFDTYLAALASEMNQYKGSEVDTIFIGGGTPSLLSAVQLKRLFDAVKEHFKISRTCEYTMEANPGTLTGGKIDVLAAGGVNRVSLGVQSFNDTELKAVGRIHSADDAYNAVMCLSRAGIENINIDLMASLPYQTVKSFSRSLNTAVSLPIKHISVYSLIIEKGTPLKEKYDKGIYRLHSDDEDRELYRYTEKFLQKHGFMRYEISNYALSGYKSRHNLKYWDCEEYIGLGLAAHSYVNGVRYYNTPYLNEYLDGHFRAGGEMLTQEDMRGEFMMLGLRKTAGVAVSEFKRRFGHEPEFFYGDVIDKFIGFGMLSRDGDRIKLTARGLDVANSIMCEFV